MVKVKPCRYKRCIKLIHFTTPGTNEEDCPENWRACQGLQYSSFQNKINEIDTPKFKLVSKLTLRDPAAESLSSWHLSWSLGFNTRRGPYSMSFSNVTCVFWMKQTIMVWNGDGILSKGTLNGLHADRTRSLSHICGTLCQHHYFSLFV